jgi:hypothetical protein
LFAAFGWVAIFHPVTAMEQPDTIFSGIPIHTDDTLPPGHVKMLEAGGKAIVFRLNDDESVTPVAEWDEGPCPSSP